MIEDIISINIENEIEHIQQQLINAQNKLNNNRIIEAYKVQANILGLERLLCGTPLLNRNVRQNLNEMYNDVSELVLEVVK